MLSVRRLLLLSEEALRREHGLRFADASDAVLPAFVAGEDLDFNPQKINRHLDLGFGETRHAHGVFLGRDNYGKIAADTTGDEALQLGFGKIVVIDVALRKIDMCAELFERAFETFWCGDGAERADERVAHTLQRQLFTRVNILEIKRFVCALDDFGGAIIA